MGRMIPYIMENKIHVPNHQPVYTQQAEAPYAISWAITVPII